MALWMVWCLIHNVFRTSASPVDYWSDTFDEGANCKQADLINQELKNKSQCESSETGNDTQTAFLDCKRKLQRRLVMACSTTKIQTAGDLLYCKSRTTTECCFNNHTCMKDWNAINRNFGNLAKEYMRDKEKVVGEMEKLGYQKCYSIDGYDASKCAEDCKAAETGDFAKNCSAQGGFFKCCIRRDKQECHMCRFCCSLPLCAMNTTRGVQHRGLTKLDEKDQANKITALDIFNVKRRMYKGKDYRCLKPDSSLKASEWPHYVHEEFQDAISKDQLEKAKTIKFDINFINYEDPEVLERMTGPEYQKYWKATYGYDFVTKLPGKPVDEDGHKTFDFDTSSLAAHCLESEYSKFGKKCKKKGGLFKCCFNGNDLTIFEKALVELARENLTAPPSKLVCGGENISADCVIWRASHGCTTKDPLTGKLVTEFEIPTIPEYQVGGNPSEDLQWGGLRTDFCTVYETCRTNRVYFDPYLYEKAYDKESFCEAAIVSLRMDNEKVVLGHMADKCKKQKPHTVFICEDDTLHKDNEKRNITKVIRETFEALSKKKKSKKKDKKKKGDKKKQKRDKKSKKKTKKKSKKD